MGNLIELAILAVVTIAVATAIVTIIVVGASALAVRYAERRHRLQRHREHGLRQIEWGRCPHREPIGSDPHLYISCHGDLGHYGYHIDERGHPLSETAKLL